MVKISTADGSEVVEGNLEQVLGFLPGVGVGPRRGSADCFVSGRRAYNAED